VNVPPGEWGQLAFVSPPAAGRLSVGARARLVWEILFAYVLVRRELRRAPISCVLGALRTRGRLEADRRSVEALQIARRLGHAVCRTLGVLPGDTRCLVRSLVLTRLLARRGITAKLVIGARTAPDFSAHAWVECDGRAVLAPGDTYGRLVEL
jgi:hypothetical protein